MIYIYIVLIIIFILYFINCVVRSKKAKQFYLKARELYSMPDFDYMDIIEIMTRAVQLKKSGIYLEFLSELKQKAAKYFYKQSKLEYNKQSPNYTVALDLIRQANNLEENRIYIVFMQEIQQKYSKYQKAADDLYKQAKEEYSINKPNYKKIIELMENSIKLLNLDEYREFLERVKKEYLDKEEKAENLYNQACKLYNETEFNYNELFIIIQQAINLIEKEKYQEFLNNINEKYEQYKKAEVFYQQAKNLYDTNEHNNDDVLRLLKKAIKLYKKQEYQEFANTLQEESAKITQAEEIFAQAKSLYDQPQSDILQIIDLTKKAIEQHKTQEYTDFLQTVENQKVEFADNLYTEAQMLFEDSMPDYEQIKNLLAKALTLVEKKQYKTLIGKVKQSEAASLMKQAGTLYQQSPICYDEIISLLTQAISLDNEERYVKILEKVKNEKEADILYKQAKQLYETNEPDYTRIILLSEEAIGLTSKNSEYIAFLQAVKDECAAKNPEQYTETLFKQAKILYGRENKNYNKILEMLEQAHNIYETKSLKTFYAKVQKEYANKLFNQAKNLYTKNNANYSQIIKIINQAIQLYHTKEYTDFLDKIEHEKKQNSSLSPDDPMIRDDWRDF